MSERFTSKTLRSVFDLGDLYASLDETQRERLMRDIRDALDLWSRQSTHIRWLLRLCCRPKWVDDDKGLAHINVRMTEDDEPLFSTSLKMRADD